MNTRTVKAILFTVLGVFTSLGCSVPPPKPTTIPGRDYTYTKEYTSWLIRQEMKKHEVKGLSIALVDDQKVVWAQGFGYADEANQILASAETNYRVGSISKLFTATAVMQLAEQGRIDIDTPLQNYLPEFSIKSRFAKADPITPRNLMAHHSGLPTSWQKGMWNPRREPFVEVTSKMKDQYTSFPPNYVFAYSNLGVTLLGHMIENITGQDFPSYMKKSVLAPMGMEASSFLPDRSITPFLSKGYLKGKETEQVPLRDLPSGGLYSNVMDLGKFMQMVFGKGKLNDARILEPQTLAEMLTAQNENVPLDLDFRIGLGWFLSGLNIKNRGPVAWHSGGTVLFHSQLVILPDHKLGLVVLANSSTARGVVDKVALEAIRIALMTKTGIEQSAEENLSEADRDLLSQKKLVAYVGHYATNSMKILAVKAVGEHLRTTFGDRSFSLIPLSDGSFRVQYKLLGLIPVKLEELEGISLSFPEIRGHKLVVVHQYGERYLFGEKILPYATPQAWLNRIGSYEFYNLGNDTPNFKNLRLCYQDQLLRIEFTIPFFSEPDKSLAIKPISDSEAVILGLGSGMGETIRIVTSDGKERLTYSGYELRKR